MSDETFADVNSIDKTLMEKVFLTEQLDKKDRTSFLQDLWIHWQKKKLRDNFQSPSASTLQRRYKSVVFLIVFSNGITLPKIHS